MASIHGIAAGLHVTTAAQVASPARKGRRKKVTAFEPEAQAVPLTHCVACLCRGQAVGRGTRKHSDIDSRSQYCRHCRTMFGGFLPGCTRDDPEEAIDKIEAVRKEGYLMVLRTMSLGTPDGRTVSVDAGDIFVCMPSNPPRIERDIASKENTWAIFTLKLQVGPYAITLFPHEFASISLFTVMDLRKRGEVVDCYISADDNTGHFTPTPELREQILDMFGPLVGS